MAGFHQLCSLLLLFFWVSLARADYEPVPGVQLEGELVQGGLLRGHLSAPLQQVFLDERKIPVAEDGSFLLGFDRDAKPRAELVLVDADGQRQRRSLEIRTRDYAIQRIDGLPKAKVSPAKTDWERIRRDIQQVKEARARVDEQRTDYRQAFRWPVTGPISGVYGSQRILNGKPRRPHYGVDIAAPTGTPVHAPADGLVTLAHDDMFYSGGTLIIDHGQGLSSSFLHLSAILVQPGQRVRQGDPIARVGATGRVTGAHLDWRMNWFDAKIDPQLLVGPMPD